MNGLVNLFLGVSKAADKPKPAINIEPITFAPGKDIGALNTAVGWVIDTLFVVAGATAIIYFIYSGILYITAAGNPDSAKKGQQGLMNASIGIVIVALSYYLVTTIAKFAVGGTS
jgi:hypothetical protein